MTVNFWCGFVAFMAVCFGFVMFFAYDYTGNEPETVLEWILIIGMWLGMGAKEGRRKTK